ncbi:unnamed protein product [Calypogeia fissa]
MMATGLSWWQDVYAFYLITIDILFQKIQCRHLPKRLPLQVSPQLTVIVTGATSGIGVEISGELARAGAHVVLAVRNTKAGKDLVQKWVEDQKSKGGRSINAEVMELNLLSLASVRAFAKQWNDRQVPLHVLINNAGIFSIGVTRKFSEDGYEQHMQVNHLGHALLSLLLLPSLIREAPSRIINVNSDMHHFGFVDPEDMNLTKRKFSAVAGYGGSKLAQILFSRILQKQVLQAGVYIVLNHPGEVQTDVVRTLPKLVQKAKNAILSFLEFSPLEGARVVLFSATDPKIYRYAREMDIQGAPYISSACRPRKVASYVEDLEYAEKVYNKTLELVGLPKDYVDQVLGYNTIPPVDGS